MTIVGDVSMLKSSLTVPLVSAPMFLVSGPELVLASCKAGIVGAMPAFNARTTEQLDSWLAAVEAALVEDACERPTARRGPHAVNLIVHRSNARLQADLGVVVRHEVPILFSSVGSPRSVLDPIHGYGGLVFSDVASVAHARKAIDAGVDGLVLLCSGAGGNAGWLSPFAFVPEVRRFYTGPLVVAGAVGHGRTLRAIEVLGADLAYVGTRFIGTRESMATDAYRDMLIASSADDVVLTSAVTGIPANFLQASLDRCGFKAADEKSEGFDTAQEIEVFKRWRDIWAAGQGVGAVDRVTSVAELVEEFRRDYEAARGDGLSKGVTRIGEAIYREPASNLVGSALR